MADVLVQRLRRVAAVMAALSTPTEETSADATAAAMAAVVVATKSPNGFSDASLHV